MNTKLKVLISCLILLVIVLSTLLIVSYLNNSNDYTNRRVLQSTISCNSLNESLNGNNSIKLDDLSIELSQIGYYPTGNEYLSNNNVLDFTFTFRSDDLDINNITFDYIVFDNDYKILNTSFWDNLDKTKSYAKGFVKEHYQENSFTKLNDHSIFVSRNYHNHIREDFKTFTQTISSSLDENIDTPKQISVVITNLRYQFTSSEFKEVEHTDLEFVLDFNV